MKITDPKKQKSFKCVNICVLEVFVVVNCYDFDHENETKNTEATDCDALRATWSS